MVKLRLNKKKYLKLIYLFIEKQIMCENMINSGLSFKKGTSILRKKVLLGSQGFITINPEWRFYFHGNGVRITNEKTKEVIDYDYLDLLIKRKRKIGGFDSWRLALFIKNQIKIGKLDKNQYFKLTKQESWEDILIKLEKEGFIIRYVEGKLFILTSKGGIYNER